MPFIVFEGLDGSGKSTLIRGLEADLKKRGAETVVTREPGGTELGEALRETVTTTRGQAPTPRAEALLYQAIRAQHVDLVIQPALKAKKWVLCDRYRASSIAFQSGARGLKGEDIEWLNEFSTQGLQADVTVLLDLTVEESGRRLEGRYKNLEEGLDRFEQEKKDFHERVRQSYLRQAKGNSAWIVLESSQSPEVLLELLLRELKRKKLGL